MRTTLLLPLVAAAMASAATAAPLSRQDAKDRVLADGFTSVAKTEVAPDAWRVWAAKDGVAYEINVDANTGVLTKVVALDPDD